MKQCYKKEIDDDCMLCPYYKSCYDESLKTKLKWKKYARPAGNSTKRKDTVIY